MQTFIVGFAAGCLFMTVVLAAPTIALRDKRKCCICLNCGNEGKPVGKVCGICESEEIEVFYRR